MNVDQSNKDEEKVPSAIDFAQEEPAWGNFAQNSPEALKWFKLLILKEEDLPDDVKDSEQLAEARAILDGLDKTAEEVIGESLELLWNNALELIKADNSRATVEYSRFRVIITLPAICQLKPPRLYPFQVI